MEGKSNYGKMQSYYDRFLVIFLVGCAQSRQQDIIVGKEEIQIYDYQVVESSEHDIKISECEFSIPEHGQVDAFCVYDNIVYYSVGFSDYLENNTGFHFVEFEEKYSTQIRSFNMELKEDSLLYQYKDNRGINLIYTDIAKIKAIMEQELENIGC